MVIFTHVSFFNVTLSAPGSSFSGDVSFWILAHSN
jgi:hypothetical protein